MRSGDVQLRMYLRWDQNGYEEDCHAQVCVHRPRHRSFFTGNGYQTEECRQGHGHDADERQLVSGGEAGFEEEDYSGYEDPDGDEAELTG
jgi:hypothetical protein